MLHFGLIEMNSLATHSKTHKGDDDLLCNIPSVHADEIYIKLHTHTAEKGENLNVTHSMQGIYCGEIKNGSQWYHKAVLFMC